MALIDQLTEKAATFNAGRSEGRLARAIEEQTAKLPSDVFLWTAVGCMTVSLTLKLFKQNHLSLFVGQWVPSLLLFGLYNKMVKVAGHDRQEREELADRNISALV